MRTCGVQERCTQGLCGKPEGNSQFEDPGVDGRIILIRMFRKCGVGGVDWIELVQDRDRWRAFVNAVMAIKCGEFLD
jgi:hypothetical protein